MAARTERAATLAREQYRKVVMIMPIAVADRGTIGDHRVVKQCPVAFLHRLQALEEIRQVRGVEFIDILNLRQLLGVIAVVRDAVVAFADVDKRVGTVAAVVREDHRRNPRGVGLEREDD